MARVNAEKAFELMYELFKAKSWLNEPGVMSDCDHHAEDEAVSFMLTLETAVNWGNCTESARKVVNSLLIDFLAKLRGPMAHRYWDIPEGIPKWRQAAIIISAEIQKSHPHFVNPMVYQLGVVNTNVIMPNDL